MTEEEKEDYLKYIENYTLNDLADEFNTQNFIIKDKDKFNEILLYYHFKEVDEIDQLQQKNKQLKEVIDKAIEYIKIYRSYQKIDNKDYLKGRDEIGCLDICQVDELLDILKEVNK